MLGESHAPARSAGSLRLLVPTLLLQAACGTSLASRGHIEETIGQATYHDIMAEVPEILQRHGYPIYNNRETGSTLYLETGWQERAPFEDEAALGVDYARTRFIARARRAAAGLYSLRVTSENEVRGLSDGSGEPDLPSQGWGTMEGTDMYREYVGEIVTEIQLEVNAGLRTYRPGRPPGGP